MTFLLSYNVGATSAIIFAILVVIALVIAYGTARIAHSKDHYHQVRAVRYLLPIVCIIFAAENLFMACKTVFFESEWDENNKVQKFFIFFLLFLQTTQVPLLLLVTFDVCYFIHKRRSVNFCGMFFDEGHRVIRVSSVMRGTLWRNLIRIIALMLLISGLVVNFARWLGIEGLDQAGKTGLLALFKQGINAYNDEPYLIMSLVPEAVLILCSLYLGAILWKYGSSSSMVVHSSFFTPWCSLFIASIINLIAQLFESDIYPLTSNIGYIVYIFSILMLLIEIDKDMDHAEDFANFLRQIKKMPEEDINHEKDDDNKDKPLGDEIENRENCARDIDIEMDNIPNNFEEGKKMMGNEELDKTLKTSGNAHTN